jgi:hypothetical protein
MALGSNRDYVKTHNATVARMKEAGYLKLWECPNCKRKNGMQFVECPRCNTEK